MGNVRTGYIAEYQVIVSTQAMDVLCPQIPGVRVSFLNDFPVVVVVKIQTWRIASRDDLPGAPVESVVFIMDVYCFRTATDIDGALPCVPDDDKGDVCPCCVRGHNGHLPNRVIGNGCRTAVECGDFICRVMSAALIQDGCILRLPLIIVPVADGVIRPVFLLQEGSPDSGAGRIQLSECKLCYLIKAVVCIGLIKVARCGRA